MDSLIQTLKATAGEVSMALGYYPATPAQAKGSLKKKRMRK